MAKKSKLQINLNPNAILCERHKSPWNDLGLHERQLSLVAFCVEIFNVIVGHRPFIDQCSGKVENINRFMPNPLCCWVEKNYPKKLFEAYFKFGKAEPLDG